MMKHNFRIFQDPQNRSDKLHCVLIILMFLFSMSEDFQAYDKHVFS